MPADLAPTIDAIRYFHRQRVFAMEQRKRTNLSLLSFLRMVLGWSLALPDADRKRIAEQAADLVELGEREAKGKPLDVEEPAYTEWHDVIAASLAARAPFDEIEKRATIEMERLAKELPIYFWTKEVRGFGAGSLAVIIAEAGDLSNYATHSKLWKRMGLAVMDGVRQGGLSKSAPKQDWIEHGYNRERRSRMWNIGDALIKGNKDGPYRTAYLARKEYEAERARAAGLTVAPSAKIPVKRKAEFMSEGHIHRRAQRYMEKRLLKDLWRAWRDERKAECSLPETASRLVPTAQLNEQGAKHWVPETARDRLPPARLNKRQAIFVAPEMADKRLPVA